MYDAISQAEELDPKAEEMLLPRLDDPAPGIVWTPEFKERFRQQVLQRRRSRLIAASVNRPQAM